MADKPKPMTPFAQALAARRGDVPHESLTGAAKSLFKDTTLSNDQLKSYTAPQQSPRPKQVAHIKQTFKRG